MAINNRKVKGFTLTEVLLAVAIVGIIAALIIPAIVTKFNTTVLDHGFTREEQAIQTAIDVLPIKENKADFGDTSMFSSGTKTMDESAGKFIKRYLRVSKYYGDATTNKDLIKSELFAPSYYEYSGGEKKQFTIDSKLVGACAKLKNGASLCLAPQIGATSNIQGIMDLNGPKGPNIWGRDLRNISLSSIPFTTRESLVSTSSSTAVNTVENPGLAGDGGYGNLCNNDYSVDCCNYHFAQGKITSSTHQCCSNSAVASSYPACAKDIVLYFNYYPTTSCTISMWNSGTCTGGNPYVSNVNTYAHVKGSTTHLATLPAPPPPVFLYCDSIRAGYLSSATVQSSIIEPTSYTYFTRLSVDTSIYGSRECKYESASNGIVAGKGSLAFSNGLNTITFNGVNWEVEKH